MKYLGGGLTDTTDQGCGRPVLPEGTEKARGKPDSLPPDPLTPDWPLDDFDGNHYVGQRVCGSGSSVYPVGQWRCSSLDSGFEAAGECAFDR
jgi:hypothetical protein